MVQIVELLIGEDKEVTPVKLFYIVQEDGSIRYKCELDGVALSTFSMYKTYEGATAEEALSSIAQELIKAKAAFLEL